MSAFHFLSLIFFSCKLNIKVTCTVLLHRFVLKLRVKPSCLDKSVFVKLGLPPILIVSVYDGSKNFGLM